MKLDISDVPADKTALIWVKMLFETADYKGIIVSEDQAKTVFCVGSELWDLYRGVPIYVAVTPKRLKKSR